MAPNIRHVIMWSYEVWSELDAQIAINCWRVARILCAIWSVDFALVDERGKSRMQEKLDEVGALISKLRLGDDEMSIETYIQMKGEQKIELELRVKKLVDIALGIDYAQGFDLSVDLHLVDVDDVASLIVKLSDAKRRASLLWGHLRLGYYFWDKGLKEYVTLDLVFIMIYYYLINKIYINK